MFDDLEKELILCVRVCDLKLSNDVCSMFTVEEVVTVIVLSKKKFPTQGRTAYVI